MLWFKGCDRMLWIQKMYGPHPRFGTQVDRGSVPKYIYYSVKYNFTASFTFKSNNIQNVDAALQQSDQEETLVLCFTLKWNKELLNSL